MTSRKGKILNWTDVENRFVLFSIASLVYFVGKFFMLLDMVQQYDKEKVTFYRELREKVILQLGMKEDHKKIVSFLAKVGIVGIDEKDKVVHVGVPNEFVLTQAKKFFQKSIKEAINTVYNPQFNVKFVIYSGFANNGSELLINLKKVLNIKESTKEMEHPSIKKSIKSELAEYFGILFDPIYRFDNFVVGANSNIAFSASKATAEHPGQTYNPLFLYGHVWLWKTHLMQAIGNEIMEHYPEKVVLYLPTSKLIDEIVLALRGNKLGNLLKKFEEVDVLLIDDIQFLADKEKTQEIFYNIFNDFQLKKKQIILSSDRPPKELVHIEPRLKSRFALGLVADIQAPDFETRIAILQSKLNAKSEALDFEFLELIAKHIKDNVRELEGALNILITRKKVLHAELTRDDVVACLKTLGYYLEQEMDNTQKAIQSNTKSIQNFANLVDMVAQYYNVWVNELKSESRRREITVSRQILMLLAKKYFWRTLEKIGDYFGGKNHASVIYAINNTEKKMKTDTDMAHDYQVFVDWLGK